MSRVLVVATSPGRVKDELAPEDDAPPEAEVLEGVLPLGDVADDAKAVVCDDSVKGVALGVDPLMLTLTMLDAEKTAPFPIEDVLTQLLLLGAA